MRLKVSAISVFLLALPGAWAAPFPEITGKVLSGYQGWHACPGAGFGNGWKHWARGTPAADNLVVDMYPDLREFDVHELCAPAGLTLGGKQAYLYSAQNAAVVMGHFRWMQEYGLDGVLAQRFLTEAQSKRNGGDVVLRNIMNAARKHVRVFALEYDLSGAGESRLLERLKQDWMYLVDSMQVNAHPGYLHHGGRPVLALWGMGFQDGNHPPALPADAAAILAWFRRDAPEKYRVAYLGGVPGGWRNREDDAFPDPGWTAVYDSMDIVQPWAVGRYADQAGADNWSKNRLLPDQARLKSAGRAYQPVIFPGFSWKNLNGGAANQIPRRGGRFLWRQALNARKSGAPMLKLAMFDEVDESTALYKLAPARKDAPDQGFWLTLDADGEALPSDWYLRLTGAITRMFRGEIPMTDSLPIRPGDPIAVGPGRREGPAIEHLRPLRTGAGILFAGASPGTDIRITDARGALVRRLRTGPAGAVWDGRDETGHRLGTGLYQALSLNGAGLISARAAFAWTPD
jgi:hypothetical protein